MPARRTKGDGGLTQRHDHKSCPPRDPATGERPEHKCRGRWQGTVPLGQGSTQKKYVYGATKAEAREKLRAAVNAKATGTLVVSGLTVEAWLWHWLDNIAEVRPQTYHGYKSKIRTNLVPHLGRHKLTLLQPDHIRLMYRSMREAGLSESTLRQTHAILARALKVAMQEGKIGRNPIQSVKPPSTKTKRRPSLTVAQARQVLAATDDARWWLAVFYGMRQGEVLGLRWCDVDFEKGYLEVAQTLQRGREGKMIFGLPKTDAGERVVPLTPLMAARLKLVHSQADRGAGSPATGAGGSTALVFDHPRKPGHYRGPKQDWEAWRVLLDAASEVGPEKLPKVSLHSARNTAASLLEAADVPPRLVGQIIGHSNVKQTESYQFAAMEQMLDALQAGATVLELTELPGAELSNEPVDAELVEDDDQ